MQTANGSTTSEWLAPHRQMLTTVAVVIVAITGWLVALHTQETSPLGLRSYHLRPSVPDTGRPHDVAAVRVAAPELMATDTAVGQLPTNVATRTAQSEQPAEMARRQALIDRAWDRSQQSSARKEWDDALADVASDDAYSGYTDNRFTVDEWNGITVRGNRATAVFIGHDEYYRADMGWDVSPARQYRAELKRSSGSAPWKLLRYGFAPLTHEN